MNPFHHVWLVIWLSSAVVLAPSLMSAARGQAAPAGGAGAAAGGAGAAAAPVAAAPIQADFKTASSPTADQQQIIINAVVANVAALLASDKPAAQTAARKALIADATIPSGVKEQLSPAYAQFYAAKFSDAIEKLLTNAAADRRAKLNAAIATVGVAEGTKSSRMDKAILALLAKGQPDFARLWGMRATKFVLPALLAVNEPTLLNQLVLVVKESPKDGAIAEAAYQALDLSLYQGNAVKMAASALLDVANARLEAYKDGCPEEPAWDKYPADYLTRVGVWNKVLTPAQQKDAMQLFCNQLAYAAARWQGQSQPNVKTDLKTVVDYVIEGVAVAASLSKQDDLNKAAKQAGQAAKSAGAALPDVVQPLCTAIAGTKDYSGIKIPKVEPLNKNDPGQGPGANAGQARRPEP